MTYQTGSDVVGNALEVVYEECVFRVAVTRFHGVAGPGEVRGRRLEVRVSRFTLTDCSVCVFVCVSEGGGGRDKSILTDKRKCAS